MFFNGLSFFSDFLWNNFLIVLLPALHIFTTVKTGFVQKRLFQGIRLSVKKNTGEGGISPFKSLACTLASTIGTGNIIGVGTAVVLGGAGAVFWCWLAGLFGIATKYAETLLAVKYRRKNNTGTYSGGAMYLLRDKLKMPIAAASFAFFGLAASFGIGCGVQTGSIAQTLKNCFSDIELFSLFGESISVLGIFTGCTAAVLCGLSIIKGVKSVSDVSGILVPAMAVLYAGGCLFLLTANCLYIPKALVKIITEAFGFNSIAGGFTGAVLMNSCRFGISRGLFSSESGMGSAPLVAVEAKTNSPDTTALITSTGTFWDTGVLCLLTGLTAVTTAEASGINTDIIDGESLMYLVFSQIPYVGRTIIVMCILAFAFTTVIGWSCYGEKCWIYLFGENRVRLFRFIWIAAAAFSPLISMETIWYFSDIFNGLMTVPNTAVIFLLSSELKNPLFKN